MRHFLSILLFLPLVGWGQIWPTDSAHWHEWTEIQCIDGSNFYCQSIFLNGDTTIGQETYSKLYDTLNGQYPAFYIGGIREDTSSKRVWYFHNGDTMERLLYDFSANIGDTVMVIHNLQVPILFVDTVVIGGIARRRLYIDGQFSIFSDDRTDTSQVWIEGIGSSAGLFYSTIHIAQGLFKTTQTCVTFKHLAKFHSNDTITYVRDGLTEVFNVPYDSAICEYHTLSIKNALISNEFFITPNPTKNTITFQFPNPDQSPSELNIYDNMGRLVYSEGGISQSQFLLDVSGYPSGIYHYQLLNPKKRQRSFGKFVKQ